MWSSHCEYPLLTAATPAVTYSRNYAARYTRHRPWEQ